MPRSNHKNLSRRELLRRVGMGMPSLGLMATLGAAGLLEAAPRAEGPALNPLSPKAPPLPAKAKRVIHLFMNGGPSQVDTFDPKPAPQKFAGKELPIHLRTERRTGAGFPSPFSFAKHGQSGIEVSEVFPHVTKHEDVLCVVRSMHTDIPNHESSLIMMK